jgi:catechol 2,3-dioxygenase-like lactoylglutathione lyase family enzyme
MEEVRHVLTILAVEDPERSARFYTAAFGWRQAVSVPVYAELLQPGGLRLGLYQRVAFGRNTGRVPAPIAAGELAPAELYLHAGDPAEICRRLRAAGARELSPLSPRDWGDEVAYFADPDGHVIAVGRPLAQAG